jgi:outer membrane lipoprotein-sorting protein
MKKIILFTLSAFLGLPAGAQTVNGTFLLKKLDEQQKLGSDLTAKVSIRQKKPGQSDRALESIYYRRDGDDSFLIIMTDPPTERGNGYLRVKDNFWVYRKNTRSFQHINRDENISGTDMKGGDFETRKTSDLYVPATNNGQEAVTEEILANRPVWRLEIKAKVEDITYPKQILWLSKDNYLPIRIQGFSGAGALMNTQLFLSYQPIGNRYIPVKMVTRDEFEKGNLSAMEITAVELKPIDSRFFTKAKLEEFSQ